MAFVGILSNCFTGLASIHRRTVAAVQSCEIGITLIEGGSQKGFLLYFRQNKMVKNMNSGNEQISPEKAALLKQRDQLRERLEAIEQDYKKGLSADSEDQAIELENADVLAGIAKATAEELQLVEDQLSKM